MHNLGRTPVDRRLLGEPRHTLNDNIKMYLRYTECEGVNTSRCCQHGNKTSGSIRGEDFLDLVSEYQVLKEDCAP
jgi:hypothetical protein